MLHAWLGFILLLAFFVLTFGIPWSTPSSSEDGAIEQVLEGGKNPVVFTGLRE